MSLLTAKETCQALVGQEPWASDPVPFAPATLRGWKSKGLLPDHGVDYLGRALFDLREVARVALDRRPRHAERTPLADRR